MFIGEYHHSIDQKGRLALPIKFRSLLGQSAVVSKGLDGCLYIHTKESWQIFAAKIAALPMSSANARSFARLMLSGAMEVEIDKLGRVVVPPILRSFAQLNGETILAGVSDRVEIWNKDAWLESMTQAEQNSSEIAERLEGQV